MHQQRQTGAGPREKRRQEAYLRQAEESLLQEKKEQKEKEQRAIEEERFSDAGRGVVTSKVPYHQPSPLDVGPDFGQINEAASPGYWYSKTEFAKDPKLCDGKAVTYWDSGKDNQFPKRRNDFSSEFCLD